MTCDKLREAVELLAFLLSYLVRCKYKQIVPTAFMAELFTPTGRRENSFCTKTHCSSGLHCRNRNKQSKQSKKTIKHEARLKEEFHSKTLNFSNIYLQEINIFFL